MLVNKNNFKLDFPATERNRESILSVLNRVLPARGDILEIASGSGQHAVFFQKNLPNCIWQTSDVDPKNLASIKAWIASDCPGMPNPIKLDAEAKSWTLPKNADVQAIVCINMLHIVSWSCAINFLCNAGAVLNGGGILYLYGPYKVEGIPFKDSNINFDCALRTQNPEWGIRNLENIICEAEKVGFSFEKTVAMPANNLSVIFRREDF